MTSITPVSFCGNVIGQTRVAVDKNAENNCRTIESSKNDMVRSYDEKIEQLEAYKQFALKLDNLMRNDPDIQKAVGELPNGFDIEVANECYIDKANEDSLTLSSPVLLADEEMINETQKGREMDRTEKNNFLDLSCEFDKNGPDKQEILDWLANLKTFFNQD